MTKYVKMDTMEYGNTLRSNDDEFSPKLNFHVVEEFICKVIKNKIIEKTPLRVPGMIRPLGENKDMLFSEIIEFMNRDINIDKYEYILFEKLKLYLRENPSLEHHKFDKRHQQLIDKLDLDIYINSKALKKNVRGQYNHVIKELFLYVFNRFLMESNRKLIPEQPKSEVILNWRERLFNYIMGKDLVEDVTNNNLIITQEQIDLLGNTLKCIHKNNLFIRDENIFFKYYLGFYKRLNPTFKFIDSDEVADNEVDEREQLAGLQNQNEIIINTILHETQNNPVQLRGERREAPFPLGEGVVPIVRETVIRGTIDPNIRNNNREEDLIANIADDMRVNEVDAIEDVNDEDEDNFIDNLHI